MLSDLVIPWAMHVYVYIHSYTQSVYYMVWRWMFSCIHWLPRHMNICSTLLKACVWCDIRSSYYLRDRHCVIIYVAFLVRNGWCPILKILFIYIFPLGNEFQHSLECCKWCHHGHLWSSKVAKSYVSFININYCLEYLSAV